MTLIVLLQKKYTKSIKCALKALIVYVFDGKKNKNNNKGNLAKMYSINIILIGTKNRWFSVYVVNECRRPIFWY